MGLGVTVLWSREPSNVFQSSFAPSHKLGVTIPVHVLRDGLISNIRTKKILGGIRSRVYRSLSKYIVDHLLLGGRLSGST